MTTDLQERNRLGPYLLQTVNLVLVNLAFDIDAIRAVLPPELEPSLDATGFALFYTSAGSETLPPSSAFYLGVFLDGRDAPDGSPGVFVADGYYSNEANLEVSRNYSSRFNAGWSQIEAKDGVIAGRGGPKGATAVEFKVRLRDNAQHMMLGTHQYYGESLLGGLTTYSLAFAARLFDCENVWFEVTGAASPILKALLKPPQVIRSSFAPGAPLYFSSPRHLAHSGNVASTDASHVAIVDAFGHFGRGAVVVEEGARIVVSNPLARGLLGSLVRFGRIETVDLGEQTKLDEMIRDAAHDRGAGAVLRTALRRPDGVVLIVQAATYRGGWKGRPTALLLVSDPSASSDRDVGRGLELVGLTPAEARIAAEIGQGRSAREAANRLGLAESTVRSALKLIYAKLGISNRAELANFMARV